MNSTSLHLRDTSFVDLMQKRICNVLIIANPYDAFMLEDDGRVDEKIFSEYAKLGLRFPPRFIQVFSKKWAEMEMAKSSIDLVICMPSVENNDVFDIARSIKNDHPNLPIVVLTPFSHGITQRIKDEDLSAFEYVFCWLGNTELLLSIIKLIEDKMNLEHDIESAGVQMILLVEDGIRFYSSILPNLYKFVLNQSLAFATEALNSTLETLRMRGRPKIVLARTYEEAWSLYERFADNTLGVISDCRFPIYNGSTQKDEMAGFKLLSCIRARDPFIPLIMESSESERAELARKCGAHFINKNSKKMDVDLRDLVRHYFGFGDFIFRDPKTMYEVARIHNLKELQDNIMTVPAQSLLYHIRHNNVSRWLSSRALFPIAEFLKKVTWDSMQDLDAHRQIILDAIVAYRRMKNQGVVAVFHRDRFDQYSNFTRIGDGSLGGKGRGLAFLDRMIKKLKENGDWGCDMLFIPKTLVLCTDIFDEFMDTNDLYQIALSDIPDEEILQTFLRGSLPHRLIGDLSAFLDVVKSPIAIRSSSLLEDSHYQPFAGIYSTYMISYDEDKYKRLEQLSQAIKAVYASVFYRGSKDYMTATSNVIDQEKMAVILQQVVGQQYGERFYPTFSGVARSVNYYPIGDEKAEEGTVSLAMGLGKYIVDGGTCIRLSPYHPEQILQMSEMEIALKDTQTTFLALKQEPHPLTPSPGGLTLPPTPSPGGGLVTSDSGNDKQNITAPLPGGGVGGGVGSGGGVDFQVDDGFNLVKVRVRDAEKDGSLPWICSTFDPLDQCIYDGYYEGRNRKIISFAGVLHNGVWPLPDLLKLVLKMGQHEMQRPVEIEFACNLHPDKSGEFYLLQIRPMVDNRMQLDQDLREIPDEECLLRSHNAIGHGIFTDIEDVVYVKTIPTPIPSQLLPKGKMQREEVTSVDENVSEAEVIVSPLGEMSQSDRGGLYSPSFNTEIAEEIEHINRTLLAEERRCLLIGPGRWGSSDPWLGIPVKWPHISSAQVIVEAGLENFQVDPSQGTHFFQNLTSLGVGYLTIDAFRGDGKYDEADLAEYPVVEETKHVRHIRLPKPLTIKIDGAKKEAVVQF